MLRGDFDAASEKAEVMLDGWDRAGRLEAGRMSPAFFAAAMLYWFRVDDAGYQRWLRHAAAVCRSKKSNCFRTHPSCAWRCTAGAVIRSAATPRS